MRYLTFNLARGEHFTSDTQSITRYLRRKGRWGTEPASGPDDPAVLVLNPKTGRPIPKSRLLGGGGTPPPPSPPPPTPPPTAPAIDSLPVRTGPFVIDATQRPVTIEPGYHYVNPTRGGTLFDIRGDYLVTCESAPGKPLVMTTQGGHCFSGFRNRLSVKGVIARIRNPGIYGQPKGRFINGQEMKHLVCHSNDIRETGGILINGKQDAATPFQHYLGIRGQDKFSILYNLVSNIDGRVSNGGIGETDYVRSTTGDTHTTSAATNTTNGWRWNPSVPVAERTSAAKSDPQKWSPTGWFPRQFLQIATVTQHPDLEVAYNMVVSDLGKSRVEDVFNLYGGTGGTQARPMRLHHNYAENWGGWDPHYVEGVSTSYNNSNKYPAGAPADGYQSPAHTQYSGSIFIQDDRRGDSWPDNGHYTEVTDNWCVGQQIQNGNSSYWLVARNKVFDFPGPAANINFTYGFAGFFLYSSTATAPDNGVQRLLVTGTRMHHNEWHSDYGVNTGNYGNIAGVAEADKIGNTIHPTIPKGGQMTLRAQYLDAMAALGVKIGVPDDRKAV